MFCRGAKQGSRLYAAPHFMLLASPPACQPDSTCKNGIPKVWPGSMERESVDLLGFNHATSNPPPAVTSGISHLIVSISMNDKCATVGVKEAGHAR